MLISAFVPIKQASVNRLAKQVTRRESAISEQPNPEREYWPRNRRGRFCSINGDARIHPGK
jgi:hypothetical protein